MILSCEGHREERTELTVQMKEIMSEGKWNEVRASEDSGLSYILGFECENEELNQERINVTSVTKKFLNRVWRKRECANL